MSSSEPIVFLLVSLLAEITLLWSFARTPPREQPNALIRAGIVLTLLLFWFASLVVRGHASPEWVGPFSISLVVTALLWLLADLQVRRHYGLRFVPTGVRAFEEQDVAGRCVDTPWTKLLGAANLVVTITRDEVWVRPKEPIPAVAMGLVHRIPLRKIHFMERVTDSAANVRFEYAGADGWCRCVELQLRQPAQFIRAVREGQIDSISI